MLDLEGVFDNTCVGAFGGEGVDEGEFEAFLMGDLTMFCNGVEFACKFLEEGLSERGVGWGAVLFHKD